MLQECLSNIPNPPTILNPPTITNPPTIRVSVPIAYTCTKRLQAGRGSGDGGEAEVEHAAEAATAAQATASGDSIATASTDSQPGSATAWHEEWRGEAEAEQWEVEDRGTSCTRQCTRHRCRTQQVGFPAPSA